MIDHKQLPSRGLQDLLLHRQRSRSRWGYSRAVCLPEDKLPGRLSATVKDRGKQFERPCSPEDHNLGAPSVICMLLLPLQKRSTCYLRLTDGKGKTNGVRRFLSAVNCGSPRLEMLKPTSSKERGSSEAWGKAHPLWETAVMTTSRSDRKSSEACSSTCWVRGAGP